MSPRLRVWLIGPLGAVLGVVIAFQIADERYTLGAIALGFMLWIVLEWMGATRPETVVLAAALVGYILANRGFAQLSLSSRLPLLPAEFALLVCVPVICWRAAFRQAAFFQRDSLNVAILTWFAIGASRLVPDIREFGAYALRDFATFYYCAFFFVGQAMARDESSVRILQNVLLGVFSLLPLSFVLFSQFSEVLFQWLVFRGSPLVFYKDDLVAAYLFAGFFFLGAAAKYSSWWRFLVATAAYGVAFSINSSRAAIVGLLTASTWWALARRWTPLKWQAALVPCGLVALALVAAIKPEPFHRSRLYALYEHVVSMVDVTGTRRYSHDERFYVGDNNRFRLVWWRSVAEEVWDHAPLLGLGFGADLSARFLRNYEIDLGDEFTTRSPHSIVFTVLGRTGLLGLAAWLGVLTAMVVRTWRLAKRARNDDNALPVLGWWSVAWVVLGSATFGVVLEGPMGAIVFWTALGLANGAPEPSPAADAVTTSELVEASAAR